MMGNLESKYIAITGASSGIGRDMAIEVAKRRGTPILLARSYEKLEKLAEEIEQSTNQRPHFYTLDVTNEDEVREVFEKIYKSVGTIDVLINNAGFAIFDYVHEATVDEVKSMFDVNVFGAIACTKLVLPHMIKNGKGHVIFVASQAGKLATPKSSGYSATKHAVLGFANSLRMELADRDIKVSTVNPGPIKTPFFDLADKSGEYQKNVARYMLQSDFVAKKTVDLIERPKRELNLPTWMNVGTKLYQLFPGLIEAVAGKQFRKK
ncbi:MULTISPECIES: SDR family NAD(P)-dependent oxidoreductase [Bacillaceae]|uniref:SDR family oxidoreductase n=1 Tax=Evansella alkalicola TaxID=745819 RepID=A0ABS6JZP8_9BACI|nr:MULTISPECIES: SDR family oxidoreductase [Bacillaceae]MBU9724059.1 SDR family oxidoreductase [Bacillus alkalicola]